MDRAILEGGVNLIDTAEQYPIPSTREKPEGDTERIIGTWLAKDKSRRSKVVIASKITGGRNVNAKNIIADCEDSLKRLGTDYLDVYNLHWPARYSPQSNWGQVCKALVHVCTSLLARVFAANAVRSACPSVARVQAGRRALLNWPRLLRRDRRGDG